MKPNKRFLFVALIIISLSGFGQETTSEEIPKKAIQMAKKSDELMKEYLNLTQDQIPVLSKMNLEFSQKMLTLYEKPGSMFGKMGDMKKIGKDRKAALEKVLTPEQAKLFKNKLEGKMRKEMKKILKEES